MTTRDQRRGTLFLILAGIVIGNALLAELIGGRLFQVPAPWRPLAGPDAAAGPWGTFTLSAGVILWPVVFILTDLVNEYFGRAGVRRISLLAAAIIAYAFLIVWVAQFLPDPPPFSPIDSASFNRVFLQSQWIIIGSITAFLLAQLIDVTVFWLIRQRTGRRGLWLRATGSTVVSQLIDTFTVGFIGLYLPGALGLSKSDAPLTFLTYLNLSASGYIFKLAVAVAVTPVLYALHAVIDRWLGAEQADTMIEQTAKAEGGRA